MKRPTFLIYLTLMVTALTLTLTLTQAKEPATNLAKSFPQGQGLNFQLMMKDGVEAQVAIYVANSTDQEVGVEYYLSTKNSFLDEKIWQQFVLAKNSNAAPLKVVRGYIQLPEWKNAEILPQRQLQGYEAGVQVNDFLFLNKAELDRYRVGHEEVVVPAGKIHATHYKRVSQGQEVHFWIADDVRPLGIVKVQSKSDKRADQNYTLVLESIIQNVKPVINPQAATVLSDRGRKFFESSLLFKDTPREGARTGTRNR